MTSHMHPSECSESSCCNTPVTDPPCTRPTINRQRTGPATFTYVIENADEAWMDVICSTSAGPVSSSTRISLADGRAEGSQSMVANCNYCIRATNECGTANTCDSCNVIVLGGIGRKHSDCYVLTSCVPFGVPDPCYTEGPIVYVWSVSVFDGNNHDREISIFVNGVAVSLGGYNPTTNTYSGEITLDRCDIPEEIVVEVDVQPCGTPKKFAAGPSCIDRKNSFVLEISGLGDYSTYEELGTPGGNFSTYETITTGIGGYNGTHIFPIECQPSSNPFGNGFSFSRRINTTPIALGVFTVRLIRHFTYTSFPFYAFQDYTYTYEMFVRPIFPCTPLAIRLKSLLAVDGSGIPTNYQTRLFECPGGQSPPCGGGIVWYLQTSPPGTVTGFPYNQCFNSNNTFTGGAFPCFYGERFADLIDYVGTIIRFTTQRTKIGQVKCYYDCL